MLLQLLIGYTLDIVKRNTFFSDEDSAEYRINKRYFSFCLCICTFFVMNNAYIRSFANRFYFLI